MAEIEKRNICLKLYVSPSEKEMIDLKMLQAGATNLSAYGRKMLIDGYIIRSDFSVLRELISILRSISNNINQIARRANETRSIYKTDLEDLRTDMKELKIACMDHLIALIEKE